MTSAAGFALSVVIPAYDEAERIGPFLETIADWEGLSPEVEVIVVDDGSTDGTVDVVSGWMDRIPNTSVVSLGTNSGKGAAVRAGLAVASGDWRIFLDADGSTAVDEIETFVSAAGGDDDKIVIGSIAGTDPDVDQSQSGLRQAAGRLGNQLIQRAALPGIEDSQRGCKLFSRRACDDILPYCSVSGWGFDVELLAVGRALGYEVIEIPIRWEHVEGSKVGGLAYLSVLLDVLRARRSVRRVRRIEAAKVAVG